MEEEKKEVKIEWKSENFLLTLAGVIYLVVGVRYWDLVRHDWKGIVSMIIGIILLSAASISCKTKKWKKKNK